MMDDLGLDMRVGMKGPFIVNILIAMHQELYPSAGCQMQYNQEAEYFLCPHGPVFSGPAFGMLVGLN